MLAVDMQNSSIRTDKHIKNIEKEERQMQYSAHAAGWRLKRPVCSVSTAQEKYITAVEGIKPFVFASLVTIDSLDR